MNEYHQMLFVVLQSIFTIIIMFNVVNNEKLAIKLLLTQAFMAVGYLLYVAN